MIKIILLGSILFLCSCTYNDMRKLFTDHPEAYTKILGEFDYRKNQTKAANNKFGAEYKRPIYTTKDKSKMYFVGGSIYHNQDVFKNTYHINGFTHLGIEF